MSADTITVTLSRPLLFNGETFASLQFRSPRAKDLIAADREAEDGNLGRTVAALASMCGVPYAALQELEIEDLNKIVAEVGPLLGELAPAPAGSTP